MKARQVRPLIAEHALQAPQWPVAAQLSFDLPHGTLCLLSAMPGTLGHTSVLPRAVVYCLDCVIVAPMCEECFVSHALHWHNCGPERALLLLHLLRARALGHTIPDGADRPAEDDHGDNARTTTPDGGLAPSHGEGGDT